MVKQNEVVAVVEGPQGRAEVVEVQTATATEYAVEFKGKRDQFKTMGEAYIEAKERAGVK